MPGQRARDVDGPPTLSLQRRGSVCGDWNRMFVFFSSRLGCLGSILVSIALTLVLLALLGLS